MLLYQAGFGNQMLTQENKIEAVQCVLFHQVFKVRQEEIKDLKEGLESLSILQLLRENEKCFAAVFQAEEDVQVTANDILARLDYSHQEDAEKLKSWFEDYIKSLEKGKTAATRMFKCMNK